MFDLKVERSARRVSRVAHSPTNRTLFPVARRDADVDNIPGQPAFPWFSNDWLRLLHTPAQPGVNGLPVEIAGLHEPNDELVVVQRVSAQLESVHPKTHIRSG